MGENKRRGGNMDKSGIMLLLKGEMKLGWDEGAEGLRKEGRK